MAGSEAGSKSRQYVATFVACGGAFATGTIYGWPAPASQDIVRAEKYAIEATLTPNQWSWAVAIMALAAAAFCIPAGLLIKTLGRRTALMLFVIPLTIGWIFTLWARSASMIYLARVFVGCAAGGYSIGVPVYVGEIAESNVRGKLLSYFQLMLTLGILFMYTIGYLTSLFWATAICAMLPLILTVALYFMPESPTYLIGRGQSYQAKLSIIWLRGKKYDADAEIIDLQNQNDKMRAITTTTGEALKRRSTVKGLIVASGVMLFFQMSGINAVIYFATEIFSAAKTSIEADEGTIIMGVAQVLATFASTFLIERLGRRILLQLSGLFMAMCTITIGAYFFVKKIDSSNVAGLGWVSVFALCLFVIAFSIGYGPIPWILLGELFESDIKSLAVSMATVLSFLLSFFVSKMFTIMREALGIGQTFWFFASFSCLGLFFVHFMVPETKGKSLQEIQVMLARGGLRVER